MTTIGYGDITATNYIEACIMILGMIIMNFTFAVSFNTVGQII